MLSVIGPSKPAPPPQRFVRIGDVGLVHPHRMLLVAPEPPKIPIGLQYERLRRRGCLLCGLGRRGHGRWRWGLGGAGGCQHPETQHARTLHSISTTHSAPLAARLIALRTGPGGYTMAAVSASPGLPGPRLPLPRTMPPTHAVHVHLAPASPGRHEVLENDGVQTIGRA